MAGMGIGFGALASNLASGYRLGNEIQNNNLTRQMNQLKLTQAQRQEAMNQELIQGQQDAQADVRNRIANRQLAASNAADEYVSKVMPQMALTKAKYGDVAGAAQLMQLAQSAHARDVANKYSVLALALHDNDIQGANDAMREFWNETLDPTATGGRRFVRVAPTATDENGNPKGYTAYFLDRNGKQVTTKFDDADTMKEEVYKRADLQHYFDAAQKASVLDKYIGKPAAPAQASATPAPDTSTAAAAMAPTQEQDAKAPLSGGFVGATPAQGSGQLTDQPDKSTVGQVSPDVTPAASPIAGETKDALGTSVEPVKPLPIIKATAPQVAPVQADTTPIAPAAPVVPPQDMAAPVAPSQAAAMPAELQQQIGAGLRSQNPNDVAQARSLLMNYLSSPATAAGMTTPNVAPQIAPQAAPASPAMQSSPPAPVSPQDDSAAQAQAPVQYAANVNPNVATDAGPQGAPQAPQPNIQMLNVRPVTGQAPPQAPAGPLSRSAAQAPQQPQGIVIPPNEADALRAMWESGSPELNKMATQRFQQFIAPKIEPSVIGTDEWQNPIHGFVDSLNKRAYDLNGKPIQVAPNGQIVNPNRVESQGQMMPGMGADLPHGDAFLKTLPSELQDTVRKLATYQLDPRTLSMRGNMRSRLVAAAAQYDPTYDDAQYPARKAAIKEFTSGGQNSPAGTLTAGNTALLHLGKLYDLNPKIGGTGDYGVLNSPINMANSAIKSMENDPDLNSYNTGISKFVEEATKFYRGTGGNEADLQRDLKTLSAAQSPEARAAAMRTLAEFMHSKIEALQARWHTALGDSGWKQAIGEKVGDFPIVQAQAQREYDKIVGKPGAASAVAPHVTSKEDYDRLPSGTIYTAPDGSVRTKK